MRAHPRHAPAGFRNAARFIERIQIAQQPARGGHCPAGRCIQKGERARLRAPGGAVQGKAGKLCFQNLGPIRLRQAAMQGFRPKPDRHPRRGAPRTARALLRCCLADPQGHQPRQPACCVQPWRPAIAAIHHNAHAGHGQRCLGDGGRQHHLALPIRRRVQRQILFRRRQFAMQGQHQRIEPTQPFGGAANLPPARQESQHIAGVRRQRLTDCTRHGFGQVARVAQIPRSMADFDRISAAQAFNHRRGRAAFRHQPGEARAIKGRGHGEQAQFGAESALEIKRQGQCQISIQIAFMRLVEKNRSDAFKAGIALQAAHQQAFRHHLNPRAVGKLPIEPRGKADGAARLVFPDQGGHAARGSAGSNAARFQHQDAPFGGPGFCHQRQRHDGGLARAGGCDQHGVGRSTQRSAQRRQRFRDRQFREHGRGDTTGIAPM